MHFHRVAIAATDPISLCEFYVETLGFEAVPGSQRSVVAGETTLWFELGDTDADHLAFTVDADVESVIAWVDEHVGVLETDEGPSIRFDFLDCDSVYFEDPAGNIIEYICYDGQSSGAFDPETDVVGVTEVGMAVPDVQAFIADLTAALDVEILSQFGDGTVAFVGDKTGRFVVAPTGRPWFPTDRNAALDPVSVQCDAEGTFDPEGLPYRVNVDP